MTETKDEKDHDLLIEIKTNVGHILNRLSQFVTRDEFEPIARRDKVCRASFVTKDEFRPVKLITYGLIATICVTVIGALLSLIILHKP